MNPIRNSAKAVIVRAGQLLTIECVSWKKETYYILPGGGQTSGETLLDALRRECREELGVEIECGPLLWVREYIGKNHEFAEKHREFHQVEFMFQCALREGSVLKLGSQPDDYQVGLAWLPLDSLANRLLFPKVLKRVLLEPPGGAVYLGDVN